MKLNYIPKLILLCIVLTVTSNGQAHPQQAQQGVVFFETLTLPSTVDDKIRLDLNYRIMKNFFILTRADDADNKFEGAYELSIEIFDQKGSAIDRGIKRQKIFSDTPRQEFPEIDYIQGGFSFDLHEGEYRFLIRLNDQNSQRRHIDRDRRVRIEKPDRSKPGIFDIVFIEPVDRFDELDYVQPVNLGGNLFFGQDSRALLVFSTTSPADDLSTISATVYRREEGRREATEEIFTQEIAAEQIFPNTTVQSNHTNDKVQYGIYETEDLYINTALLPMNGKTFEEGQYRFSLSIEEENQPATKEKGFRVIWIDKPASLRNLDFAIEMLELIMSESEYRELRRGSSDVRNRKFHEYWKRKDPNPDTAFNPVMTEFYRRVDYAAREFTTIREQNGARTDRGKIYIIYGPPTEKDRSLIPGQAPRETWKYKHLNKKFIFADQSRQGNYQLVAREDL